MSMITVGSDGQPRCSWSAATPEYQRYHDEEWGFPVGDDRELFEKLCLEGFQSGLSWRTILEKRERFRVVFKRFEIDRVARFGEAKVETLLGDAGIVRHRGKIEAVINNAKRVQTLIAAEGSLSRFLWSYAPAFPRAAPSPPVAASPESEAMSKDLKRRGFKFVGPTTLYSLMQAMGMVNDHAPDCCIRSVAEQAQKSFRAAMPDRDQAAIRP